MTITKLTRFCGAEITDTDLRALDDDGFATLQGALFDHGMIVIRDQDLTPDDHIALAERFGRINVNRFFNPVPDHPRVAEVRTKPDNTRVIGERWHTDHSYDPEPAMCSILVARELPPEGGDTMFASTVAPYHALSTGLRDMLLGLSAWHTDASFANTKLLDAAKARENVREPSLHPVIIAHPVTGVPSIYVNGDFTTHFDGWTEAESAPLLAYLYDHITQPVYTCRLQWKPGSVAIWDNRLVHHMALKDYAGHARLMHRITVAGQPLGPFTMS